MHEAEYRKLAGVEDRMWYFHALHTLVERQLRRSLGNRPARLLDAGCGTGGLIFRMSEAHPAWRWTGVDLSPLALELAAARWSATSGRAGEPPTLLEADITALPFPDAQFDAITSADVLYHVAEDNAALRELRRVLRPGGALILNLPAHPWLWSYHDEAVAGLRRYRRGELRSQLLAAGFTEASLTHWNTLLLPLIAARRKLLPPPESGSDVQGYSWPLEVLGRAATAAERIWLQAASLPFGSSLLAVAR
jgi:SAM-dependent methyltransferase